MKRAATFTICVIILGLGVFLATNLIAELFLGQTPPLGTHNDFLAFYGAAHLVLVGQSAKIFDPITLTNFQRTIIPYPVGAAGYMPYLNPPFVAIFLAPLAFLSALQARVIWFFLNLLLTFLSVHWLTKTLRGWVRISAFLLLLATFPLYQALIESQLSIIILLVCLIALHFANREQYLVAGGFLSVLFIKPQLALFVIAGLLFLKIWRPVAGMIGLIFIIILLCLPSTGLAPYLVYPNFLLGVGLAHINGAGSALPAVWKGALNLTEGINGFFAALFGQAAVLVNDSLTVLFSAFSAGGFVWGSRKLKFKSKINQNLFLVASVLIVLLLDPHLYAQDIVLIYLTIPALLKLFQNSFLVIVSVATVADLTFIDQFLPAHLFTLILFLLVLIIFFYPSAFSKKLANIMSTI